MSKRFIFWFIIAFTQLQAAKVADLDFSLGKWGNLGLNFTFKPEVEIEGDPPDWKNLCLEELQGSRHGRALTANPCPPGNYDNAGTCTSCGTMCAYCEDGTGNCLGCQDSYTMKISSNNKKNCECKDSAAASGTCICPSSQWFDGSICQLCSSGQYYSTTGCTACSATTTVVKFISILKVSPTPGCCSDGKYLDSSSQKCIPCAADCALCSDGDGTICNQCIKKLKMSGSIRVKKTSCCDPGEFYNSGTKLCGNCPDTNCKECEDTGTGKTCIQCSKLLKVDDTLSVKKTSCCDPGKFYDSVAKTCSSCPDGNCNYCADSGTGDTCIQCSNILAIRDTLKIKKTTCCSDGKYIANSLPTCQNCFDNNCKVCDDSGTGNTCLQCFNLVKMKPTLRLKKTSCCDPGKFYDSTAKACKNCPDNCNLCEDGSTGSTCIQCSNLLSMSDKVKIKKTSCCGDGLYISSTQSSCANCKDKNCNNCEDSGDGSSCLDCAKTITIKDTLKVKKTSCCGDGLYISSTQSSCANCKDKNCNICEDSGDGSTCLDCAKTLTIKDTLQLKKTTCCPNRKYISGTQSACADCKDKNCNICEDSGDGSNCLDCAKTISITDTLKAKKTSCCGDGKYVSSTQSTCNDCKDKNCNNCEDSSDGSTCIECAKTVTIKDTLKLKKTSCCGDGKFVSGAQSSCANCKDKNCNNCEDSGDGSSCLDCAKTLTIKDTLKVKKTTCCLDGKYISGTQPACVDCKDKNCNICEDSGDGSTCLDCAKTVTIKDTLQLKKTSCCGDGKFISSTQSTCIACNDANCEICEDSGNGSNCLKCINQLKIKDSLKAKKTSCCGDGQYATGTQPTCANCKDDNCNMCEDSGDGSICLQCSNALSIKDELKIKKTTCCPDGQYVSDTQKTCLGCADTNCNICEDSGTGKTCLDCVKTVTIKDTLNIKKTTCCSLTTYWNVNKCDPCPDTCNACEDVTGVCITCSNKLTFTDSLAHPASCCAVGTYYSSGSCISCDETCGTCDPYTGECKTCVDTKMEIDADNGNKKCKCIGDQVLTGTVCSCTTGSFNGQSCSNCDYFCNSCTVNPTICEACINPTRMVFDGAKCKCAGNNQIDTGTGCICKSLDLYFSAGDCIPCDDNCSVCNDDGSCKTCSRTVSNIKWKLVSQNSCCPLSQYYDGTKCTNCGTFCTSCDNGTSCKTCADSSMTNNPDGSCSCLPGYFFNNDAAVNACQKCTDSCFTCTDITGVCTVCKSDRMMINQSDKTQCICKAGQHQDVAGCVCDTGTYYSASACIPCENKCATCSDSGVCLTCVDDKKMLPDTTNTKICKCKADQTPSDSSCSCSSGKYFDGDKCSSCVVNCDICTDFTGVCTSCAKKLAFKDTLIDSAACCSTGTYYSGESCVACSDLCAECDKHTGQCTKCQDPSKMIFDATDNKKCKCAGDQTYDGAKCVCANGQFNGAMCSVCGNFCSTCEEDSLACTACINTDRMMVSGTNNKECICKGLSQTVTPMGCICDPGRYFAGADCATCGLYCSACADNTGLCSSCQDNTFILDTDKKSCVCITGLTFNQAVNTCKCPTGYFDGSVCQPCGTHCDTCDSTKCISCISTPHLILDPSNNKNCACESTYHWITLSSTCEQCPSKTYYDGNKCTACFTNCDACDDLTGKCSKCADQSRMMVNPTDPTACICKGSQSPAGSTCSCPAKSYFDGNDCSSCSDLCSACTDLTGICQTCVDTSLMIVDDLNTKNCKCKSSDLAIVSGQCICSGGKQWNGLACTICGNFCSDCDVGSIICKTCIDDKRMETVPSTLTCQCKEGLIATDSGCVCPSTSYFDSTVCTTCGDFCNSCTDLTGACTACQDTVRMEADPTNPKICRCKGTQIYSSAIKSCSCADGYFDGTTCQSCSALCLTCDSTKCLTCQNIANLEVNPTSPTTCHCASGYNWITATSSCEKCSIGTYYDGNKCATCSINCESCLDGTGVCGVCKDTSKMMVDPSDTTNCICKGNQLISGSICSCPPANYFNGNTCQVCWSNCSSCKDLTGECIACNSNYVLEQRATPLACTCPAKTYDNTSGCSPCGTMCASCSNGGVCSTCDDNRVQEIDQLNTNNCVCKTANYYDGTACKSCGTYCSICDAIKCIQCMDSANMILNPIISKNCDCKLGTYYSSGSTQCDSCIAHCAVCSDGSTCSVCDQGYYFDGSVCQLSTCSGTQYYDGNTCKNCEAPCATCSSPTFCNSCTPADFTLDSVAGTCNCASGKYYDSTSKSCKICGLTCKTCTGTADNCMDCIDTTMINISGNCTCPDKSYFNAGVCNSCVDPCLNCNNAEFCLSCIDAAMTYTKGTGVCKCKDGTYFDLSSHQCMACDLKCATCSSGSSCLTCKDLTMSFSAGACTCPAYQYFDTQSLSCKKCDATCGQCTDASPSSCIACRDPTMTKKDDVCTCLSTQYFNLATFACHNCIGPCKSCTSDTFCTSCLSTATLNSDTGICSCAEGQYYNSTLSQCSTCPGLCKTCSSYSICTSCVEKTNALSNGVCTCLNGYYALDKQCVMCPSPCSTCTSATTCTGCKKHATLNSSSKKCACDRGFGLNSTDTSGYCVATCNKLCTACDIDSANVCSGCVTNAELTGTTCACTANSAYSSSTSGCACSSGYTLSNSKCVLCKRYLAPTDVASAEFSSTWTSVSIKFNVQVDTTLDPSCSKTFTAATVTLFGTGAVCSWTDKKTLKIALGTEFSLRSSTISLDGTYIVKDSTDPCTTNYQPLSITPSASTSPVPTAVITGQSSFTLGCGTDPLTFSSEKSQGALGGTLTYSWSVTSISPSNSKVSDAINGKTTSSITIDRSLFDSSTTTTLTVKLTIANFLTITSSATFTTTITGGNALTVIFDQGNTVSMKSSTSITLKAKVTSLCSSATGTINWVWTYDSGPTIDSASILANANGDKLTINANALTASSTAYVFKATASQASNGATTTGSATVSITVSASPLSISLSKTSGDISPDKDYTVNAQNSKDPDDPNSTYKDFSYKWTCVNSLDNSVCTGTDGKTPISDDTDSTLLIPSSQMVKGAQWELTCTISKDSRTKSATISISILKQASGVSIEIEYKVQKFSLDGNLVITAQVTAASTAALQWSENSEALSISPNYLSTMSISSSELTEGASYTFTLSIAYNGLDFKVNYPVAVNLGAACTGSVSVSPSSGSAITDIFKLSIDGCYDKDDEDYPLSYTYLDYSGNKAYTLGYTTEINSISTCLFPNANAIIIHVCDYLKTCNDYKKDMTVGSFSGRLLESSSLMDSYLANTVDVDNVPSTISLFCGSATIDSELFNQMWTDLQNYIASNTVTNDILENALGATYSMTTQTEQMSIAMFQTFAEWLSKIIVDNPSLVPSQDNMVTIVALADNYLAYGNFTKFADLSLEGYILNIDKFLSYWEIAATKDDLVTQGAMDGTQNTDTIKIYKYRDFPTSMENRTVPFSSNRAISMPTNFSYSDSDVMNIKLHYFNTSNDYSDLVMLSFAQSGTYKNYVLETTNETVVPFSTSDHPIVLEMPISQNITEGNQWTCLFYSETSKEWIHDGCVITEVKNTSVVFEAYHFSMFKLGEAPAKSPPEPYPQPSGPSCDDNYAPLYILVVILFIYMILAPIMVIYDRLEKIGKAVEASPAPIHAARPTERGLMLPSFNLETEPRSTRNFFLGTQPRESVEPAESEERSSDNDSNEVIDSVNIDLTENSYIEVVIPEDKGKTELAELIEGHLVFGLVYFRSNFTRWARLFTLTTVIIFELLLEGLLLSGFENTDSESSGSTATLFSDYEAKYFGYTILALTIAIPIEIFLIVTLSIDRNKAPVWTAVGVSLGTLIIIGSIIEIVMLSFSFCFEWSGYWAICFLYGILIQIFVFETFYMIVRWEYYSGDCGLPSTL